MSRVYLPYTEREECQADGMWRIVSGALEREAFTVAAAALLRDGDGFLSAACRVVDEWPNSCQTILTAPTMNHQAWIGWAACFLATNSPEDCTRLAWHRLTIDQQDTANLNADLAIQVWHGRQRAIAARGMLFDLGETA